MAYEKTEVAVTRSQEQIRTVLRKAGADRIAFGEVLSGENKQAGVEFLHLGIAVRVLCPIPEPDADEIRKRTNRSRSKSRDEIIDEAFEQQAKRIWRVIHWSLKARMEAVDEGLETFEQAFLPHIIDPATGQTIWQTLRPQVEGGALNADGGAGLTLPRALTAGPSIEVDE